MKQDDFGDRMKAYERVYTDLRVPADKPLCLRIDGKGFSKFTKSFQKPFDDRLRDAMIETTESLVERTHAKLGYTQSDEITLVLSCTGKESQHLFDGKVSKLNSIVASMATAFFNRSIQKLGLDLQPAFFDCRSFAVDNLIEASNVVLWRVQDCRKNSISSLFRWTAGHAAMKNLSGLQMIGYLKDEKQVLWDDLPDCYKFGTFSKRFSEFKTLTEQELAKIPEAKRPSEDYRVERSVIKSWAWDFGALTLEDRVEMVSV